MAGKALSRLVSRVPIIAKMGTVNSWSVYFIYVLGSLIALGGLGFFVACEILAYDTEFRIEKLDPSMTLLSTHLEYIVGVARAGKYFALATMCLAFAMMAEVCRQTGGGWGAGLMLVPEIALVIAGFWAIVLPFTDFDPFSKYDFGIWLGAHLCFI